MFFGDTKKKNLGAAILMGHMGEDGKVKDTFEEDKKDGGADEALEAIADDLITAVHAKDVKGVMDALHAWKVCSESKYTDEAQEGQN